MSVFTSLDRSVSFKSINWTLRFLSSTKANTGSNLSNEINPTPGSTIPGEMSILCGRFHLLYLSHILILSNTWNFPILPPSFHGVLYTSTFHICYQPFLSKNTPRPLSLPCKTPSEHSHKLQTKLAKFNLLNTVSSGKGSDSFVEFRESILFYFLASFFVLD